MTKTAAYWEGWLACQLNQGCKYDQTATEFRHDWADGFAAGVSEQKKGKVWWKSKVVRVGLMILVIGVVFIGLGQTSVVPSSFMGAGLTITSLLFVWLRTITDEPLTFGTGYFGGSSFGGNPFAATPPPPLSG